MATIRDVAGLAGVSISTVSLALNSPDRVSPETRRKVEEATRSLGFSASPLAQSLKRGRSRLIGMVVGDITNPFFGRMLREVERCATEADHLVVINDTNGSSANERAILRLLADQRVAGVLLAPHGVAEENHDVIRSLPMPVVLFDHRLTGLDLDFVGTDNIMASAMLAEHLVRLGHRRIGYIGGTSGLYTAERRREGYEVTLRAHGIPLDGALMIDGRYDGRGGYDAAMRLMTMPQNRPTAILAASNVMAIGALQAMNELGVPCPAEVSLAGIDDVPWFAVIRPRITGAVQPVDALARAAAGMLLDRIGAWPNVTLPPREVILPPSLIIGESTAPPRSA